MSIKATCPCGAEFKANLELAGKPVKCPKCGQAFTVPKPQPAADLIRATCGCGKALQAKPEFAGKRVKCPACGQPLAIPSPNVETDPLNLGDDPLGLGDLGVDPLGLDTNTAADPLGATLSQMHVPAPTTTRSKRAGITQDGFMTAAGWVALCFGAYQALACAVAAIRLIFLVVRYGSMGALIGISPVLNVLLLALGVWLCKLGIDIVRQQMPRESLERAAQASMVYIGLFILGLLLSVFSLVMLMRAPAPFAGALLFWVIASIVLEVVYILPPAFILYVDSRLK